MKRKIFITGCARSGTTLLARLFHAFENCQVMNEEVGLEAFCNIDFSDQTADFLVGKRTQDTIFSNTLSDTEIVKQTELIANNQIIVINCVRDGRHVVHSWVTAWQMYDPQAWINSIIQAQNYSKFIELQIKYEDLIENPDKAQATIWSLIAGLKTNYDFSDYPEFVPEDSFKTNHFAHSLRPINNSQGKRAPKTYRQRPNDIEYFETLLSELNYIK